MGAVVQYRYKGLDGLRGVAALSVVLLHYVSAFAPFLIGMTATRRHSALDQLISTSPLGLPLAANFAVCIFFVLSGFVLSAKFFKTRDNDILILSAAKRYFRLMIPAMASILLAYVILRLGLFYTQKAAVGSESTIFLTTFWQFPAHLGQAVFQGLYGIWFGEFVIATTYNFVLWTMHYELYGSFLIFMYLALFGKHSNRWIFYVLFSIVFLKTYFLGFIAGMAICDIYTNLRPAVGAQLRSVYLWLSLLIGVVLGTWTTTSIYIGFYNHLSLPFFSAPQLELTAHMVGAILVVLSVLELKILSSFFETKPMQYLGRVSFSLYLTHPLVLGSLASYIFYRLLPTHGYRVATLACVVISVPLTFVVASLFTRYVDSPSIVFSKKAGNFLLSEQLFQEKLRSLLVFGRNLTAGLLKKYPQEDIADEQNEVT
jgi:peptidoglycan/LPS O-acetylase OafA/YrhL